MFLRTTLSSLFRVTGSQKIIFSRSMATASERFEEAQKRLKTLKEDPGNDVKLNMYALFKQATVGECTGKRPGMLDMVGRFKYDAWHALGKMTQDEAKEQYAKIVDGLAGPASGGGSTEAAPAAAALSSGSEFINLKREGKIFHIILNRPQKKNALTQEMYRAIQAGLEESGRDKDTTITVISGTGDYFSSGNDLSNFMVDMSDVARLAKESNKLLHDFVRAFIDHPKPLVGLVNGHAIGVVVSTLALYDVVLCSDKATFHTPFSALGQSPEGCSAFTFPRFMGPTKAAEFLIFGRKLTAQEAFERNLVTDVIPQQNFQEETAQRIKEYSLLPPESLSLSKNLIRDTFRDELHKVNRKECDLLEERWQSQECMNAVMNFFSQKSKI